MTKNVVVPGLGESVSEATLIKWHKNDGEAVTLDEPLCELETDKANVDVPSPAAGVFKRLKQAGQTVKIGETIASIDTDAKATAAPSASAASAASAAKPAVTGAGAGAIPQTAATAPTTPAPAKAETAGAETAKAQSSDRGDNGNLGNLSPAVRRLVEENQLDVSSIPATGPGGRVTKEDVVNFIESQKAASGEPAQSAPPQAAPAPPQPGPAQAPPQPLVPAAPTSAGDGTRRVPMSKIRKRIAERLVQAQQTAAILTTFNEVDLQNVMDLRSRFKEKFEKKHGIGLGFMSFFAKAVVGALKDFPTVNAEIDGDDIVYHDYVHLGIAVSTDRGLAVPVLRNTEGLSFAQIESEIKRLATATREGKLGLNELSGGTFTITNGGVFGSLLSTPILNPPQSAILGMHTIQKRPVVVNDQVVVRPMMYVALSYDHRLIDGRESVSFLVRVKELLEDPGRLMLDV